jgi:hypothetical protein
VIATSRRGHGWVHDPRDDDRRFIMRSKTDARDTIA